MKSTAFRSPFDQPTPNPGDPFTDYKNVIMAAKKKDLPEIWDEIKADHKKNLLTHDEYNELRDMVMARSPKLKSKLITVQDLASKYLKYFETKKRKDDDEYIVLKDGTPQELKDLAYAAHQGMTPDDYKYEFVQAALRIIADKEDEDLNEPHEQIDGDVDVYNSQLLKWVSSNLGRSEYVDEAVKTFGGYPEEGLFKALMYGQYAEREEVYFNVLGSLREIIEDMEE